MDRVIHADMTNPRTEARPERAPTGRVPARTGRHSAAEMEVRRPGADGRRVLVVGGGGPLDGMIIERLSAAGHLAALHTADHGDEPRQQHRGAAPTVLTGDRSDSDEVVYAVASAEIALGGLDVLIVVPTEHADRATVHTDAAEWAGAWSATLATDVLAAACASHAVARSFMARRLAGRIILIAPDGSFDAASAQQGVSAAAIAALGAGLARELQPHGIGVSVITAALAGTGFGLAQVADVVEALLATPVLTGVDAVIR